jgi:hypothetical protein
MERKGFIGGSDCVKIMQGNWLELWQVKTGRVEPDDLSDNIAVQLGVHTEQFNLDWFARQHDSILGGFQSAYKKQIGDVPVKGTVDAMNGSNPVEAKHTNAYNSMDDAIKYYMPQLQMYSHLSQSDGIWVSIIFGNNKWESAFVSYDEEYFNSMWAVVSDFWGYVLRNEEPVGIDTPTLSTNHIPIDDMVIRDASRDNQFCYAAITYVNYYEKNRVFDNAKKDLKQMVGDNEREVYNDQISVKRDKRGSLRITRRNQ